MRTLKHLLAATAASVMTTAAMAADLPIAPPPPPPPVEFGGWYLRGDIGFSNQNVKTMTNDNSANYAQLTSLTSTSAFNTAGIYDLGVGYQFNNWFRVDVTGQYRGKSNFLGTDVYTASAYGKPYSGYDAYTANKTEWLFLANAYADLGTWWCITPYIGAGVGAAQISINGFTDSGTNNFPGYAGPPVVPAGGPSFVTAANGTRWNFAWALHAGLAYHVTPNMTIDLGYSYVNMGNGVTGATAAYDGSFVNGSAFTFHTITSNDLKIGLRWAILPTPAYVPPPLYTKG